MSHGVTNDNGMATNVCPVPSERVPLTAFRGIVQIGIQLLGESVDFFFTKSGS